MSRYQHVVLFQFKPDTPGSQIEQLSLDLLAFSESLSGISSYACGKDARFKQDNADFAISAVFETKSDLETYLQHPDHQQIISKFVTEMVMHKYSAQFALD